MGAASLVVLDAGAAASLGCYEWLERRNSILERRGVPCAEPHPACAGFDLGDGRLGDVRYRSEISAGIAGGRGNILALLRKGALEALGGQLDSSRRISTFRTQGFDIPLE